MRFRPTFKNLSDDIIAELINHELFPMVFDFIEQLLFLLLRNRVINVLYKPRAFLVLYDLDRLALPEYLSDDDVIAALVEAGLEFIS